MARHADRRAKIDLLRAAEAVFAERGYAAAKVEQITARASVSKGAFYLHFESKDDCWREIVEGFLARLASTIDVPPVAAEQGPRTREELLAHWHAHDVRVLDFCWRNRALLGMLLVGGGGAPYAYLVDELAGRCKVVVEGWIRHGVAVGTYRKDLDPPLVAAMLAGAYDRLARELIVQPKRPDIDAWCAQVLSVFARGLFEDRGAAAAKADRGVENRPNGGRRARRKARPRQTHAE